MDAGSRSSRIGGAGGSRTLGEALLRVARRLPVPARRAHPGRRRHGAPRDADELLRDGPAGGFDRRYFRRVERRRRDDAHGRRHRVRLLDAAAGRRADHRRRRARVWSGVVHARVGQHVRDAALHRFAPRRDDGDPALRPSGHRRVRGGEARPRRTAQFQPLGSGDRRLHAGGRSRRRMAAGVSRIR